MSYSSIEERNIIKWRGLFYPVPYWTMQAGLSFTYLFKSIRLWCSSLCYSNCRNTHRLHCGNTHWFQPVTNLYYWLRSSPPLFPCSHFLQIFSTLDAWCVQSSKCLSFIFPDSYSFGLPICQYGSSLCQDYTDGSFGCYWYPAVWLATLLERLLSTHVLTSVCRQAQIQRVPNGAFGQSQTWPRKRALRWVQHESRNVATDSTVDLLTGSTEVFSTFSCSFLLDYMHTESDEWWLPVFPLITCLFTYGFCIKSWCICTCA